MRESITIIGAGNVATHLTLALANYFDIVCVAARTLESAKKLADRVNSTYTTDLSSIPSDCGMYLIAVNDDAIANVVADTPDHPGIWAHTSGSVGMEVFEGHKRRYGVFYPLQTFSKNASVDVRQVPMLIEGCSAEEEKDLLSIASKISDRVMVADSASREKIHVAAVFACNFANLMWIEADQLLRDAGIGDISLFAPLLKQTLGKLNELTPFDAMTGPARRGDQKVIANHLSKLPSDQREIYKLLTDRILKLYS